jgi:hypothetical protein
MANEVERAARMRQEEPARRPPPPAPKPKAKAAEVAPAKGGDGGPAG